MIICLVNTCNSCGVCIKMQVSQKQLPLWCSGCPGLASFPGQPTFFVLWFELTVMHESRRMVKAGSLESELSVEHVMNVKVPRLSPFFTTLLLQCNTANINWITKMGRPGNNTTQDGCILYYTYTYLCWGGTCQSGLGEGSEQKDVLHLWEREGSNSKHLLSA